MSLWLSETLRHLLLQINFCPINFFVARVYPYLSSSTLSLRQPDGIFWIFILLSREMSANIVSSSQRQWLCVRACVCMCVCVCTLSCIQLFGTPWTIAHRLLSPWDSPDKNTGVGCHFLLQGIFPTQGSNSCLLCLLHWQTHSLPLCHLGRPLDYYMCDQVFFKSHTSGGERITWVELEGKGFPSGSVVKILPANAGDPDSSPGRLIGKIPWRRKWQPTPVFLPGKFHGQRSLAGYSPWDHRTVWHDFTTNNTLRGGRGNMEGTPSEEHFNLKGRKKLYSPKIAVS